MAIRATSKMDANDICQLVKSLSYFYMGEEQDELPHWFLSSLDIGEFESRLDSNDSINLVYELDGKIVGYISMNKSGHLHHLFVSEQHQRKGIARKLWNTTIKQCKSPKYTVRSSIYAVPVYKSFGFIESAPPGEKDGIHFQPMELIIKC